MFADVNGGEVVRRGEVQPLECRIYVPEPPSAYNLGMGTKQHKSFCPSCGKTTNHVTRYQKADGGGFLTATVRCAEHTDAAA